MLDFRLVATDPLLIFSATVSVEAEGIARYIGTGMYDFKISGSPN